MSVHVINLGGVRCLFAHVPKTGGTSVSAGRLEHGPANYDPRPEWGLSGSEPSFAVLRHPRERLASAWRDFRFLRQQIDCTLEQSLVSHVERSTAGSIEDPGHVDHHLAPMVHPVHGVQHAARRLRFDRLQSDLDAFCIEVGAARVVLGHERDSAGHPRGEWTPRALDLLRSHWAEDLALWESL